MDQPVTPFDLHRMFFGDQPVLFYAEILVRTMVVYVYTLLMVRWIGGRGVAQLSMVEFVLVIALGSAVGDSMFYPDVPLLMAMLVITVVIGVNKVLDLLIVRSDRAKDVIDGRAVRLVRDGRLLTEGMAACDMGSAEIKALLRQAGVRNLGSVEHAYMESGGGLSVFRFDEARPGLPLVPPDSAVPDQPGLPVLTDPALAPDGKACCARCGGVEEAIIALPEGRCGHCGGDVWTAPETRETRGT